jgi:hypothetical protein
MSKRLLLLAASAALMLAPSIAGAVPIVIGGTGSLGSFSGTFDYTAIDDTTGTVDVVLINDSLIGGYITAFVFNVPTGADVDTAALTGVVPPNFQVLGEDDSYEDGVGGSPYGQFDIGASTFDSFEGGGQPSLGIAMGGTATFHFTLTGSGLGSLTAQDFLSTLSVPPGDGEGNEAFVVRFRGFPDNGSDKVPNDGGNPPVPEPGTLALLGLGLASLAARHRARGRK